MTNVQRCIGLLFSAIAVSLTPLPIDARQISGTDVPAVVRARNWIGTASARRAIKSLEAKGTLSISTGPVYPYHFKLLLPDKQAMDYPGYTFFVDGADWWALPPLPPTAPFVSNDRRHVDITVNSIFFLMTPPPASQIVFSTKGRGITETLSGDIVTAIGPGPINLTLVFDPQDGRPIGYTRPYVLIGATYRKSSGIQISRFEDYRPVNGVKFPFKITNDDDGVVETIAIEWIKVNQVSAADFARR